jgi:hypothetical protein
MKTMTGLKASKSCLRLFQFLQPKFFIDEQKREVNENIDTIESQLSIHFEDKSKTTLRAKLTLDHVFVFTEIASLVIFEEF